MSKQLPDIDLGRELRLEITPPGGGKAVVLNRWKSYTLSMTCRGACSFSVDLPVTAENRAAIPRTGGHTFRLFYQGALQFSGLIDERSEATRSEGTDLKIAGRDFVGLLMDSTIAAKSLRIANKSLGDIATEWVAPWPSLITGVSTNVAASKYIAVGGGGNSSSTSDWEKIIPGIGGIAARLFGRSTVKSSGKYGKFGKDSPYYAGVGTETIKTSNVRLGTTIWDGLKDLCAQIGVAPMMAVDGTLLLYRPQFEFDSTAYGDGLVIRWDKKLGKAKAGCTVSAVQLDTTISSRRSVWHVAGMGKSKKTARGKELILGNAQIKDVSPAFWKRATATTLGAELLHKPGVLRVPKVSKKQHLVRAARRHVSESILGGLSYEFMVAGHHAPSGVLWVPDTTVRVHDERNDVYDVMYLPEVERRFDMNQGRSSKLKVMPADVWLGSLDDPSINDDAWYAGMMARVWW